jgi:hypothetical protein
VGSTVSYTNGDGTGVSPNSGIDSDFSTSGAAAGTSGKSCEGSVFCSSGAVDDEATGTIGCSVVACSYRVAFSSSVAIAVGSTVSSTYGGDTGASPDSRFVSDFSTAGAAGTHSFGSVASGSCGAATGTSATSCDGSVFSSSGAAGDYAAGTIGSSVLACSSGLAFSSFIAIAVGSTVSPTYGGDTGASPDSRFVSDFSTAGAAGTHAFGSVASGSCGAATGTSATSCDGSIFSSSGAAGDYSTGTIGSSVVA